MSVICYLTGGGRRVGGEGGGANSIEGKSCCIFYYSFSFSSETMVLSLNKISQIGSRKI
jgi:hypothetical protein